MPTRNRLLRIMYLYNVFITGAFSIVILAAALFPDLRKAIFWYGFDPVTASLIVPLFIVIGLFCCLSIKEPEKGTLILKMQIAYKPAAILLILYFAINNEIAPAWAAVIIAGLLVYILGNTLALLRKK